MAEIRGPIIGTGIYLEVIGRCLNTCCCTGSCGRTHKRSQGKCMRQGNEARPLIAVPRAYLLGRELGDVEAMRLDAGHLIGLCGDCRDGVMTSLRRAARERAGQAMREAPSLLDLLQEQP